MINVDVSDEFLVASLKLFDAVQEEEGSFFIDLHPPHLQLQWLEINNNYGMLVEMPFATTMERRVLQFVGEEVKFIKRLLKFREHGITNCKFIFDLLKPKMDCKFLVVFKDRNNEIKEKWTEDDCEDLKDPPTFPSALKFIPPPLSAVIFNVSITQLYSVFHPLLQSALEENKVKIIMEKNVLKMKTVNDKKRYVIKDSNIDKKISSRYRISNLIRFFQCMIKCEEGSNTTFTMKENHPIIIHKPNSLFYISPL